MKKEINISRKKSKSVKAALLMLFVLMIIIFVNVCYFFDVPGIKFEHLPVAMIVLSLLLMPVIVFCLVHYFKETLNDEPVLIINEQGIYERISKHPVGLIKWEDIKSINVFSYIGETYWISIILKQPEIYITNVKLLKKLQEQKSVTKWGHIGIPFQNFDKEIKDVVEII